LQKEYSVLPKRKFRGWAAVDSLVIAEDFGEMAGTSFDGLAWPRWGRKIRLKGWHPEAPRYFADAFMRGLREGIALSW